MLKVSFFLNFLVNSFGVFSFSYYFCNRKTETKKTMKKYFVNGKRNSEAEAKRIDAQNKAIMESNNIAEWANIQFITII